jgi:CRISPR/Cas system CSM-associated protein Csm2 small subunit
VNICETNNPLFNFSSLKFTLPKNQKKVYIAKDRTGKPEKKKGPEPKFYGALQKVIDKIDHQEKAYAEFK